MLSTPLNNLFSNFLLRIDLDFFGEEEAVSSDFKAPLVNIKSCGRMFQIFVAVPECPNFNEYFLIHT